MKRILTAIVAMMMLLPMQLFANEGMWFLMHIKRLNHRDMKKMGLQLTAEEIYSINSHSLKDAIVQFDGGCTAEIISDKGLILTNHHCGYEKIAELSTPQDDILTNGFWAKSLAEERAPKSLSVRFFVRMDDVTQRILSKVSDKQLSEKERQYIISLEIKKIKEENSEQGKYVVEVESFYEGNEYYYFVYQDYNDVRLVGTPPNSIGKYGGDTDNWEWPRHTGDFSLFRVYTDKNGNPSEYSKDNIPMKPKHFLPINIGGIKEGDFSMILGYPGTTNRWESSFWVDQKVKYGYPAWVEASKTAMDAMKKYMDKDDAARIKYASKYAQIANYWKNRQGMIDALTAHKTADLKRKSEKEFAKWASKKQNIEYAKVLPKMASYFEQTNDREANKNYLMILLRSTDLVTVPQSIAPVLKQYAHAAEWQRTQMKESLMSLTEHYDNMIIEVEKSVYADLLKLYITKATNVSDDLKNIVNQHGGDYTKMIDKALKSSILSSKESYVAYLENPDESKFENDLLLQLSKSLVDIYRNDMKDHQDLDDEYQKNFRMYVQGMRVSEISPIKYPDANSTLRLTYGTVKNLPLAKNKVNDAKYNWYTTLKGTIAKHKAGDEEFECSQKLIDLYNKKDYGRYADKDGSLYVNFLTDHDITGGNSGSPVLNGKGELIGLAFDGNIEAMAGDVVFDKKLQRTINVDIRYILFVIDKYAGAKNIIDELKIVK